MPWTIYWDNGFDCGTWGHLLFDTEEQAREYADSITDEYIAEEIWDEEGSAEPYWLEPEVCQMLNNCMDIIETLQHDIEASGQ